MGFDEILKSKKVIICCGSGGVGKTTLSAALGVRAAQLGLRVLVLTIDPARRLANSLGLSDIQESEVEVGAGQFPGKLFASMLEMKKTFDNFITSLAPNPEVAEKVLNNNIYKQISTSLSGSQEYTALERLLQAVKSGHYDLVILDTPPTKHAIDFLNAPVKIHSLFQETVIKWFLMPFSTLDRLGLGLMNRGTKLAFKSLEKVAGADLVSNILEFFATIKDWQKDLRERASEVHRLLTSFNTGFILVSGFNAVRIEEARFFERSLKKGGYNLVGIIINRAFPLWGQAEVAHDNVQIDTEEQRENYAKLRAYYENLRNNYRDQQDAFQTFAGEPRPGVVFMRLPDFDQDIHNVQGLVEMSERLKTEETNNDESKTPT